MSLLVMYPSHGGRKDSREASAGKSDEIRVIRLAGKMKSISTKRLPRWFRNSGFLELKNS